MNDVFYMAWRYVRFNWGKTVLLISAISLVLFLPAGLHVEPGGVRITFSDALDPGTATDTANYNISQWQYRWTKNYGSPDYKVSEADVRGRDQGQVEGVELSADGRSVLLRIDDLRPVMQMAVSFDLRSRTGVPLKGAIFHTINVVPDK